MKLFVIRAVLSVFLFACRVAFLFFRKNKKTRPAVTAGFAAAGFTAWGLNFAGCLF